MCEWGGYEDSRTAIGSNASYGAARMRRSAAWAAAARQVAIPPQRMSSRVKDGSLTQIVVDAANDPLDGFLYHDDGSQGPLDTARFGALRTRKGNPGYFVSHPNLMSPPGSDFNWLPKGVVIAVACQLANHTAAQLIHPHIRINPNGSLCESATPCL